MKNINLSEESLAVEASATRKRETSKKAATKKTKRKNKISIAARFSKITKQKKIAFASVIALILLLLPLLYILSIVSSDSYTPASLIDKESKFVEVIKIESQKKVFAFIELPTPGQPKTEVSPINGILYTKEEMDKLMENAPVAVMVNNHVVARPQSSLDSADIVFETEVESGITRYLAIFWSKPVEKVGPIRSVRQYHLELLSPYNPIFIHDGYASSDDDPRVDAGGSMYIYNTHTISTNGAWREFDGVRFAPHNEYSSVLAAREFGERYGWNEFPTELGTWEFKRDVPNLDSNIGATVSFNNRLINGGGYDTKWEYNPTTNEYERSVGGEIDIDQETDQQVSAKTLVFQFTDITPTYNYKGHVIVETIGSGEAKILLDGQVINATWKKDSRTERTMYYYNDSDDLVLFNRGQIWVTLMDPSNGEFAIIGTSAE